MLAEEDDQLRPRQQPQISAETKLESVLAHEPVAKRVEGLDRRVSLSVWDQKVDPGLHLLRRVVRERECQNLARQRPLGRDQPRHATRNDLRLARTWPRDYERASVAVGDRPTLFAVQSAQQRRGTI